MSNTIPDGFEPQSTTSNYLRLTPGKHRIRILSGAIAGWIYWEDTPDGGRKPTRLPLEENPPVEHAETLKKFLAFPIWNYEVGHVQIWEITQATIQRELKAYEKDVDWGNLVDYDLEIERTGNDKNNTKYRVSPKPKAVLDKEIEDKIALPNMDALYEGKDPWANEDITDKDLKESGLLDK